MRKNNHIQIVLFVIIAAAFCIIAAIYLVIAIIMQKHFPQYSVWNIFLIYASGNNVDILFNSESIYILLSLSRILEAITLAIISSFAFTLILNRDVKLVFPDKIVIRRRTSEGSEGTLCIGILVGNPHKHMLFDVECWVSCSYLKEKGDVNKRNSEVILVQSIKRMKNYYRFSFKVTEFHKKFWQDYLERDIACVNEDYVSVIISGKSNTLGGTFIVEKRYKLPDVVIDLRNPEDYFKKAVINRFTGKKEVLIDWDEFSKSVEAGKVERENVINEIEQYAYS